MGSVAISPLYQQWERMPLRRINGVSASSIQGSVVTVTPPSEAEMGGSPYWHLRVATQAPASADDDAILVSVNEDGLTYTSATPSGGGSTEVLRIPAGQSATLLVSGTTNPLPYTYEQLVPVYAPVVREGPS